MPFLDRNHLGIFTGLNSGQSHAKGSVKPPERYFFSDISRNIEGTFFDTTCLNFCPVIQQLLFGVKMMREWLWNMYGQWNMEYVNFRQVDAAAASVMLLSSGLYIAYVQYYTLKYNLVTCPIVAEV